jgi:hypothetical protein
MTQGAGASSWDTPEGSGKCDASNCSGPLADFTFCFEPADTWTVAGRRASAGGAKRRYKADGSSFQSFGIGRVNQRPFERGLGLAASIRLIAT